MIIRKILLFVVLLAVFATSMKVSYATDETTADFYISDAVVDGDKLYMVGHKGDDGVICCSNADSEVLWKKQFDGSGSDSFSAVAVSSDIVVAVGFSTSTDGNMSGKIESTENTDEYFLNSNTEKHMRNAVICTYSKLDGELLWSECICGSRSDEFIDVEISEDIQKIVALGNTYSVDCGVANCEKFNKSQYNAFAVAYNIDGKMVSDIGISACIAKKAYRDKDNIIVSVDNPLLGSLSGDFLHLTRCSSKGFGFTIRSTLNGESAYSDFYQIGTDLYGTYKENGKVYVQEIDVKSTELEYGDILLNFDSALFDNIYAMCKTENNYTCIIGKTTFDELSAYSPTGSCVVYCEFDENGKAVNTEYYSGEYSEILTAFVRDDQIRLLSNGKIATPNALTASEDNKVEYYKNLVDEETAMTMSIIAVCFFIVISCIIVYAYERIMHGYVVKQMRCNYVRDSYKNTNNFVIVDKSIYNSKFVICIVSFAIALLCLSNRILYVNIMFQYVSIWRGIKEFLLTLVLLFICFGAILLLIWLFRRLFAGLKHLIRRYRLYEGGKGNEE